MAAQFGRTVDRWTEFWLGDTGDTLRKLPLVSLSGAGIDYPLTDLSATQDPGHGGLPDTPNFKLTVVVEMDSTTTTGSLWVVNGLAGGSVPHSFDIKQGIQHAWVVGEPVFGITHTSANGVLVPKFEWDFAKNTITFDLVLFPGSALPDIATAAHS